MGGDASPHPPPKSATGLEDTFWSPWPWPRRSSPWPWPRGLKSSKNALSSARGQHSFLNCWNFVDCLKKILKGVFYWRTPEKFFKDFFFLRSPEKNFWRPFLENTCACVLGLWPWAFLTLTSKGSVLERAVIGLGFFCVLGLGLEPRVLDSTFAYCHCHRQLRFSITIICAYLRVFLFIP